MFMLVQIGTIEFLQCINFTLHCFYMLNEDQLLSTAKKLIETKLGWGNAAGWTNQDFLDLSKKIQEASSASISHVTLKRIWGKVKYGSLPNTYTLSTLVQFIGYESWRDFKIKNETGTVIAGEAEFIPVIASQNTVAAAVKTRNRFLKPLVFFVVLIGAAVFISLFIQGAKKKINPEDYSFSSKPVLQMGIPNSVVFDYDAAKSPSDTVIIQQSWDTKLRTKLSRNQHQHTLIYYYPGFFQPKLVVNNEIVKEHNLLLKSDGWLTAVNASPVPVYFKKEEVIANGKMSLPLAAIKAQNISLSPQPPSLSYCNVQDFGEIYTDDFVFETALRNDYREGASVCQLTNTYLLCEGTAIGIPLCAKGCASSVDFFFTDYKVSGKEQDLSCFGVDFNAFVKLKIESHNGKANIYLDDKLCYGMNHPITKSKIIGIDFVFQGTGSVDYVKLANKVVVFDDEF